MKNLFTTLVLMLSLTACGGNSGGGTRSTNGQPILDGSGNPVTTVGPGVITTPGAAVNTPYSTARSILFHNTSLGAEFYKDTSGLATLVEGDLQLGVPFGYGQDCLVPAGDYALSTEQGGQQVTIDHHYSGIVINAVGPVSFTATITNVSANDTSGTWKMQGAFTVTKVGNRDCSGYALPIQFHFTY